MNPLYTVVSFLRLSILFIVSFLYSSVSSATPTILLPDASFDLQITPYISIYEDNSNTLKIDDILSKQLQLKFSPSHSETYALVFPNQATGLNSALPTLTKADKV